jgi:hypothetical protein
MKGAVAGVRGQAKFFDRVELDGRGLCSRAFGIGETASDDEDKVEKLADQRR